eukprot:CAMPEP_0118634092 /NCGR_PEP_ID=MMETSP0785-20121206/1353_1 /TAXON_ID=91992 /ORGANISM="Bolidomonas pacifica, Strain CCMP 1866" /LENGTH=193 /DNA_ID=CAMNT_0006525025 /DNA_START=154 /DNA_END=732 /DNA_ORIENTATION=-
MMLELGEAVANSKSSPFIIVTGIPTAFCSGANITLAAAQLMSTEGGVAMNKLMTEVTNDLKYLEGISFSAIDGAAAFGGGAELATSTDFRVLGNEAGVRSRMKFVQATMGVTTGWGGGTRLVELVGKEEALKILLTSEEISTTTPPNGLINFIAPEGMSALTHTESLIENIQATVDPNVVTAMKRMTRGKGKE